MVVAGAGGGRGGVSCSPRDARWIALRTSRDCVSFRKAGTGAEREQLGVTRRQSGACAEQHQMRLRAPSTLSVPDLGEVAQLADVEEQHARATAQLDTTGMRSVRDASRHDGHVGVVREQGRLSPSASRSSKRAMATVVGTGAGMGSSLRSVTHTGRSAATAKG